MDFTLWIPDSRYWIFKFLVSATCIPESKAKDFGFHEQ